MLFSFRSLPFVCAALCAASSPAQFNYQYAYAMGGSATAAAMQVVTDAAGNVYITGHFQGVADMDPGPGMVELTSAGGNDLFLAKHSPTGVLLWAQAVGGAGDDIAADLALDDAGNIYMSASIATEVDMDPGPGVVNVSFAGGFGDACLAKYDTDGHCLWAFSIGGTEHDVINRLAFDPSSGNIVAGGQSSSPLMDLDPGSGVQNVSNDGNGSFFLAVYDADGSYQWGFSGNGSLSSSVGGLVADGLGNLYVGGVFSATSSIDVDPGPGTVVLTAAGGVGDDIWVAKYSSDGTYQWARTIGDVGDEELAGMAVDAGGENIYFTGFFTTNLDLDPGPGSYVVSPGGMEDIYLEKMDSAGDFVWAVNAGGSSTDIGNSVTVDNGTVYACGRFAGVVDFDPGPAVNELIGQGQSNDLFVAAYDESGSLLAAMGIGGTGYDDAYGITTGPTGLLHVVGAFSSGTLDMDPGPATANIAAAGSVAAFHAAYTFISTGIDEPTVNALSLRPNPASGHIWIDAPGTALENPTVIIMDPMGRAVLQGTMHARAGLDVQHLVPGSYVAVVLDAQGRWLGAMRWVKE